MSRVLWFSAGAASAVYALVKARRAAENLTPDGIGARAAAVGLGARMFVGEVAAAMTAREAELRTELRLTPAAPRVIEDSPARRRRREGDDNADR